MTEPIVATVGARNVPGKFIGRVAAMVEAGFELEAAAEVLGISPETAREAMEHAEDCEPAVGPGGVRGTERAAYIRLAPEVARRRDKCGEKVDAIAKKLGVSEAVVSRAYALARRSGLSKPGGKSQGNPPSSDPGIKAHRKLFLLLHLGTRRPMWRVWPGAA